MEWHILKAEKDSIHISYVLQTSPNGNAKLVGIVFWLTHVNGTLIIK